MCAVVVRCIQSFVYKTITGQFEFGGGYGVFTPTMVSALFAKLAVSHLAQLTCTSKTFTFILLSLVIVGLLGVGISR